jgi:hypothetical protein
MNKEFIFLNYIAFFSLFIIGLIYIFKKNTSIFGYILLFITNAAFLFFITGEFLLKISITIKYFIPLLTLSAIFVTSILYFVSFILILCMYYNLHVKFSVKNGISLNIPEKYQEQLKYFNILSIISFSICALLLFLFYYRENKLNINFFEFLKYMNSYSIIRNYLLIVCFILSIIAIIISSIQVYIANNVSMVSGFIVNSAEIQK